MAQILVVEDEQSLRKAIAKKLTDSGYKVLEAKDGWQGLEFAETAQPDLMLLDIVMPALDGMTMLKELRSKPWGKNLPVILLTNLESQAKHIDSFEDRPIYFIKASTKLEEIVATINEVCKMIEGFKQLGQSDWSLKEVMEKVRQRRGL